MLVHAFLRAKREGVAAAGRPHARRPRRRGGRRRLRRAVPRRGARRAVRRASATRSASSAASRCTIGGQRFYPIQVAEKQICWLQATVRGPGGHGALVRPRRHDGAARAAPARARPQAAAGAHDAVVREMVEAMAAALPRPQATVLRSLLEAAADRLGAARCSARAAALFEPLLRNTVNATIVRGGDKINVVPSEVELELDGRALPGFAPDDLIARAARRSSATTSSSSSSGTIPGPAEPDLGLFETLAGVHPRARPGGHPGAAAPGRRHRRPLLLPRRHPDLRLPADAAAGGLRRSRS